MVPGGAEGQAAEADLLVLPAVGIRRRPALVVEAQRRGAAVAQVIVERDVLAEQELPALGVLLVEPALDGDLPQPHDGLGQLAEDTGPAPVEPQSTAETPGGPGSALHLAIVAEPPGVTRDKALALIEMIEQQRVLIGLERRQRRTVLGRGEGAGEG